MSWKLKWRNGNGSDEEWKKQIRKLFSRRHQLTREEEELILNIIKKLV